MRFRTRLALVSTLISILIIGSAAWFDFHHDRNLLIDRVKQKSLTRVGHLVQDLSEMFAAEIAKATILSDDRLLLDTLNASNDSFATLSEQQRAETIARLDDTWRQTPDDTSPFFASYLDSPLARHLKGIEAKFPGHYGEIFLTNRYGALVATTNRLTTLAHGHKYWWKAGWAEGNGNPFIDDRGFDESVEGYVLGIVVPVRIDGEVAGILKCNINVLGALKEFIGSSDDHDTSIQIVRTDGTVVLEQGARPLSTRLNDPSFEHLKGITRYAGSVVQDSDSIRAFILAPFTREITPFTLGGGEEVSIDHQQGNRNQAWALVLSSPLALISADVQHGMHDYLFVALLLAVVLALSSQVVGISLSRPLEDIGKHATIIGGTDLTHPFPHQGRTDEIGLLARALNKMTKELRQTTDSRDRLKDEIKRRMEAEESLRASDREVLRLTEEALELSESRSHELFMRNPFPVFAWQQQGDDFLLTGSNARGYEITGGRIEQFLGEPASLLYDVHPRLREALRTTLLEGSMVIRDYRMACKVTGVESTFDIHFTRAPEDMVYLFFDDISHRITIEERLRESESRLRALFDIVPVGITITDPEGNIIDGNATSDRLLGISRDEQLARNFADDAWQILRLDGTPMPPEEFASVRALREKRTVEGVEMELITPTGRRVLSVSAIPVDLPQYGVMIAYIDITEQLRSRFELNNINTRLRLATSAAHIGVWDWSITKGVLIWSDEMFPLFGVNRNTFSPDFEGWRNLVHPDDRETAVAEVEAALKGQNDFNTSFRIITPAGELKHIKANAVVVRDVKGQAVQMIGVNYDISDRKGYEEAILAAREEAIAANRSKSEFLANMSHEIRTPMNGVMGMLQLMEMTELTEEQRDYTETALNSTQNLLGIINDILDLSRVEAGQTKIYAEDLELAPFCTSIEKLFDEQASSKGISLSCRIDQALPSSIRTDSQRLRQILFNLVGNAVKFTKTGGVSVTLEKGCSQKGRLILRGVVADTGIGIPESMLENVFEPFQQVDSSFARNHRGTGLGLAIVKRLVELLGGTIQIESSEEKGTIVTFEILCSTSCAEKAPEAVAAPTAVTTGPSLNILLAEDNLGNIAVLTKMLERLGHRVLVAHHGKEALRLLPQHPFDLILMDIQMPQLDGISTTRVIRTDPAFARQSDIPIIALTAHAMAGDQERFLAAGMDAFLAKPVLMAQLQKALSAFQPLSLGTSN